MQTFKQLEARQIILSPTEYRQLVDYVKETFTNEINQKMEGVNFEHLDVEDRLLSCLRADQSGDKLRRVINLRRQNAIDTIYTRRTSSDSIMKLQKAKESLTTKLSTLDKKENETEQEEDTQEQLKEEIRKKNKRQT